MKQKVDNGLQPRMGRAHISPGQRRGLMAEKMTPSPIWGGPIHFVPDSINLLRQFLPPDNPFLIDVPQSVLLLPFSFT